MTAVIVCVTGQHREMVAPLLGLFDMVPEYDLAVMSADQSLNGLVSRVIDGLDAVITEALPDRILVHGDTATAMAAALAGFQRKIPVAHVEAGLRTYDLTSPWPEEMNRRAPVARECPGVGATSVNLPASEHRTNGRKALRPGLGSLRRRAVSLCR